MITGIKIFTDLGPGDGGKGGVIAAECARNQTTCVIKRGGAQGSHGVKTRQGKEFNFSQWGCGTLFGIPTFLSEQMVIMPVGLKNEANALGKIGVAEPFDLISADPDCICATPFHRISSRLEELLRKEDPRGTIGTGVGQAFRMYQNLDDSMTIRAHELTNAIKVRSKLKKQLDYYRDLYAEITPSSGLPEDAEYFSEVLDLLWDEGYLDHIVETFSFVGKKLKIQELNGVLKTQNGTAIVECSHGVLTDSAKGFKPHTSAIRTLPRFTEQMLRDAGYEGYICHYGVHRAYEIRHGAGPMPTYDQSLTEKMLPGSHKETNRWQGKVRAGALDINLLRYANEVCRETDFSGICLTWFDQIMKNRSWPICTRYQEAKQPHDEIVSYVEKAKPGIMVLPLTGPLNRTSMFELADRVVQQYLGVPLYSLSFGPTECDKIYSRRR
ncbi:adenylosuccinate synthetase [Candidatus Saccharibacteria bacterium]|nr:adenylosuccinate synthetase [Candidatus Saccharibacteria bacterium]